MIACMISAGTICFGQQPSGHGSMVGLDMSDALSECRFGIMASLAISDKWSVGTEAVFSPMIRSTRGEEEIMHETILTGNDTAGNAVRPAGHIGCLSMRYWPERAFKGLFLSLGIKAGESITTNVVTGIGYNMKVWKSLTLSVRYETDLIRTSGTLQNTGDLSISLNYIFRHEK